jgi:hypothetical protein
MMKDISGPVGGAAARVVLETAVAVASDQQISSQLGDETVILDLEDGVYYGLDPVGTSIWRLLQEPRPIAEIRDRIVEEYDVDPERCERELLALLRDLAERRLIDVLEPEVPRQ